MGQINYLAVVLAAAAFFAVGMVWYGVLFGKAWERAAGLGKDQLKGGASMALIYGGAFLCELAVAWILGHMFARIAPSPRAMMMIAGGFGLAVMTPAIGINYLFQRKPLQLFLIDAGHFIIGTAVMGVVFVALA
ncbi:MAG TPA: DUF1761 domain-containing protein [Croceibacterium sp.]|nr:DUF1761 domain-containing protein [Croceibacterium sp.]